MGEIHISKGELINKKIRHTNNNETDMNYKLVSDSPFIYFKQRSTFEIVADCK